ncbi:MAG: hypothetical protein HYX32_09110 [Actinobacteria bacterium]|nr:hypothetical protein [Actinomycetota bacterium]
MSVGEFAWVTLVVAVSSLPLALSVWALLDVARRPAWAWGLSGRDRVLWLFAILAGILCVPVGVMLSAWYLLRVRPVVAGVERGRIPEIG